MSITPQLLKYDPSMQQLVLGMYRSQNYPSIEVLASESFPALGYVAHILGQPIAAGFLRMVEGGFAQIDSLVSNADLPSETRHAGITAVVDRLIQDAKDLKLKGLIANTTDKSVSDRAERIGFSVSKQKILTLKL